MKKHIYTSVCVLLFYYSHSQQVQNDINLNEVSISESAVQNSLTNADRFTLASEGKIEEHHNDKRLYAGNVKHGKLHGDWQSWYQNGQVCDSGRFVNGLPQGEWKHWDAQGNLLALRSYDADKYKRISNELVRYNPRRIAYPLTVLYHKDRKAASKYLHSSYSFPHHVRRIDDLSLQQWVVTNITEGNAYQPVFDQSLHHGLFMNYFAGGVTRDSGYYKNGLRNGIWLHREAPAGKTHLGNYTNGLRTSEWKIYDASGKLLEMVFYNSKGVVNWRKSFTDKRQKTEDKR